MRRISFIILSVFFFFACEQEAILDEAFDFSQEELTVEKSKDVVIYYSDSAIVRVMIQGPTMLNHTERNYQRKEFTDGIRVEFYNEYGSVSSILTAKYAVQYELDSKVIVRDSVVWQSSDDQMLESSELIWDERQKLIYTNKFSVITTPTDTIFTQYFKANQDFSEIVMTSTDGAIIVDDLRPEPGNN